MLRAGQCSLYDSLLIRCAQLLAENGRTSFSTSHVICERGTGVLGSQLGDLMPSFATVLAKGFFHHGARRRYYASARALHVENSIF